MKVDARELAVTVAPGALLALLMLGVPGLFALTLDAGERAALAAALAPRAALLLLIWLVLAGALGMLARAAHQRFVAAPARLAEQAGVLLAVEAAASPPCAPGPQASAATQALAHAIDALAGQRDGLRADMQQRVEAASREVAQERNRLAALMAELTQSVIVCNLDGRVLLYNSRARLQCRAIAGAPTIGGGEVLGIGRSIYAVFDRPLVVHALDTIRQRLRSGAPHPSAQFVTSTRSGQLLRVQMAPVRGVAAAANAGEDVALSGFVLMLDDITRDYADDSDRDRVLNGLTEGTRASLGTLQAALEMLDYPDVDTPTRERFHGVIRDEVRVMSERVHELAGRAAQSMKTRWPLEDMLGLDLVSAAQRRIEAAHGCRTSAGEVDAVLWLRVDSFSLLQAITFLAGRLVDEYGVKLLRLRLATTGTRAQLDLVWIGQAMSTETVIGWETDPMRLGDETLALTVRDVVERHDGAFWFERERVRHEAFFRFLLPLADDGSREKEAAPIAPGDSRPEYYDFDLFGASESTSALADRPLAELSFTVFDTETTGLDPVAGDEIIQIGATRIVEGKLRRQECFDQLVDPQRDIPEASIPIHGIRPEMVAGQPTIDVVLPAFHAYARDTVLVAHNAAFDMRFLQLKEAATGVVFDQPVLDTLLLSSVVHPQQASHSLEAIAARLGVEVTGRHTALGDAIVTAEVFRALLPLLAEKGVRTLAEARAAAENSYYARLTY
ncbi:MAG: exonuclease domain-containing protein [Burkholderiales bacterium]